MANEYSLSKISKSFIQGCPNLKRFVVPNTITRRSQIDSNAFFGSMLTDIMFLGMHSSELTSDLSLFGVNQSCKCTTSDGKIYQYSPNSGEFTYSGDFNYPNFMKKGKPNKLQLGRSYYFSKELIEWCNSENTPMVVVMFDSKTNNASKSFSDLMSSKDAQNTIIENFKYFIYCIDRFGCITAESENSFPDPVSPGGDSHEPTSLGYFRNSFMPSVRMLDPEIKNDFVSLVFKYSSKACQISLKSRIDVNSLLAALNKGAEQCGFGSWDSTGYDNPIQIPDDETVPSQTESAADIAKYQIPWWYSSGSAQMPTTWNIASDPLDYKDVSTPDTTFLLLVANDEANGIGGMDRDNSGLLPIWQEFSNHIVDYRGADTTKQVILDNFKEGVKYHFFMFKESAHGGKRTKYNEYLALLNDATRKYEDIEDYELAEILKDAKNKVFGIFQSCNSGTMFDDVTPNTDSPTFTAKMSQSSLDIGFRITQQLKSFSALQASGDNLNNIQAIFWSACIAGESTYYWPNNRGNLVTNSEFLAGMIEEYQKNGELQRYSELWEKMRTNELCKCGSYNIIPQVHTFGKSFKNTIAFR